MFLLLGCLLNRDLYDERRAALADADGDGYASEDDCNDDNAAVNPAANEICDGLDNDCDGSVDEDATDATLWYQDADGDGYGNPVEVVASCTEPAGFVAKGGDCDDSVATVHPGAAETPYDGIDQDCDGADVTDIDGDGYDAVVAGGTDCDDFDALTFPGAGESWDRAYVDSDCDGDLAEQLLEFGTSVSVGRTAEGRAGANLAPLGDVDGDGSAAFLVAAYYDGAKYDYGGRFSWCAVPSRAACLSSRVSKPTARRGFWAQEWTVAGTSMGMGGLNWRSGRRGTTADVVSRPSFPVSRSRGVGSSRYCPWRPPAFPARRRKPILEARCV
jgi:hypothetical protein